METLPLLGVDVCKSFLDACLLRPGARPEERRFANSPAGVAALLAWAGPVSCVGVESTGGWERPLALAAFGAGLPVRLENPRRVRDFARASGRLNKTDRADARALAEFLARVPGRPWSPPSPLRAELCGLAAHRRALLEERTRLSNRLAAPLGLPALARRQVEERLSRLAEEVAQVEAERRRLVASDPALAREKEALVRMAGVGEATAMLALAHAGDLDAYPSAQSYAASAGLAPCRRESGAWRGRSRISRQGSAELRSGLYMAAVVAARWDPLMRGFRERLLAAGKSPKQAVVACMRKLLMRIYGVLRAVREGREPYYGEKPAPAT
jgi:transposase